MLQPVSIVYLTPRDSVAEACELVRGCAAAQVGLVVPWRNRAIGGLFDLRRLRHVADGMALDL
ncbi:MAG: hypothetical protein V1772_10730, partial [Chloroflexota bacterium]